MLMTDSSSVWLSICVAPLWMTNKAYYYIIILTSALPCTIYQHIFGHLVGMTNQVCGIIK